ncbi:hypothetical protein ACSTKZ_25345, partial [Vibrio parahaemolyticus]
IGITIHDGTVINGSGSTISGPNNAIVAVGNLSLTNEAGGVINTSNGATAISVSGAANISNSGVISGNFYAAIYAASG